MLVSSANKTDNAFLFKTTGRSLMYKRNNVGPNTEPPHIILTDMITVIISVPRQYKSLSSYFAIFSITPFSVPVRSNYHPHNIFHTRNKTCKIMGDFMFQQRCCRKLMSSEIWGCFFVNCFQRFERPRRLYLRSQAVQVAPWFWRWVLFRRSSHTEKAYVYRT
jgi:hypothetical protein